MDGKSCEVCGTTYYKGIRGPKEFSESKYCSQKCVGKAKQEAAFKRRTALVKQCRECGKSYSLFERKGYSNSSFENSKYCSKHCANHGLQRTIDSLYTQIKTDQPTGCHVWTGRLHEGYGYIRFKRHKQFLHRILWEHTHGPIPEGLQIDHLCKNTACCNVEHLRVVTPQVNTLASNCPAALNARKDRCPKCGGEFSRQTNGRRYCPPCRAAHAKEDMRRRRQNPEYRKKLNEAQNRRHNFRYVNDPEFRAARLASTKRWKQKKLTEKEKI